MRLALMSDDEELRRALDETGYFDRVDEAETLAEALRADALVVADRNLTANELVYADVWNRLPADKRPRLFYLLTEMPSDTYAQNVASLCEAHGISVVPPKLTLRQQVQRIVGGLFPEASPAAQPIAVFFGADGKVGTTMVAQCCAELLARRTRLNVGLLFLNDRPSMNYFKLQGGKGLDDVKIKLWNRILTADELAQAYIRINNLHILGGPRSMLDIRRYGVEDAEQILALSARFLDVLIVDAGSNMDRALAIGALRSTPVKYLVTTQQETARLEFERTAEQIFASLQLKPADFMLVVNKYVDEEPFYNGRQLAELYRGMPLAAAVPHLLKAGWEAEYAGKSLLQFDQAHYHAAIDSLCRLTARRLKIDYAAPSGRKTGIFRALFARKAEAVR